MFTCPQTSSESRGIASYPTPGRSPTVRRTRKSYNYLTSERMVPVRRVKSNRLKDRRRDDRALAKRKSYREEVLRNVEEKVLFLSPEVKSFVFFPKVKGRPDTMRTFRGNRALPTRTFTRIYVDIIKKLSQMANRPKLEALIKEHEVALPDEATWRLYSDPQTGAITTGLIYSSLLTRQFAHIAKNLHGGPQERRHARLTTIQAYILRNFDDVRKVPSLQAWSHALGEFTEADMLTHGPRTKPTVSLILARARAEIYRYGVDEVANAVDALTEEGRRELHEYTSAHIEELWHNMCRHFEFAAKVMLAINSIPEVKAMQTATRLYMTEESNRTLIEQKGSLYPPSQASLKNLRELSKEERGKYLCFGTQSESSAMTALQLYRRYCMRDYGISRSDSIKRFAELDDLQQAALQFPFYYPITPRCSGWEAFRKFYVETCNRYALIRTPSAHGNRVLLAALRKRWKLMSPAERERYFESDTVMAPFPLQPSTNLVGSSSPSLSSFEDTTARDNAEVDQGVGVDKVVQRAVEQTHTKRRHNSKKAQSLLLSPHSKGASSTLFVYSNRSVEPGNVTRSIDAVLVGRPSEKRVPLSTASSADDEQCVIVI